MKRPNGFDRPPAPAQPPAAPPPPPRRAAPGRPARDRAAADRPSAPQRESETEPIPVVSGAVPAPATPRPPSDGAAAEGPWWTKPKPKPDAAGTTAPAGTAERPEAESAARRPFGDLPSNREITRALRAARKERARVERGEVRRFTKRSRRRKLVWLASLGTVVALVLGVTLTAFSPLMALRTIEVTGTARIDAAAVKKAMADQLGKPLPLVDQGAVRADLAAFPLIRSYSVESHPPNTLVVRIVERQPIGVVASGAAFDLVDAAKVTIQSTPARPDGYPLIAASGAAEEADASSGFAAAASVLSALPPALLAQVDTITAVTRDDVSFTLRGSDATVVWGSGDESALKAAALNALLASVPGAGRYDVSSPHSVTTG